MISIQLIVSIENNLNVSFSRVRYVDIAPLVGLNPSVQGEDIPTFGMFFARLPNSIFVKIVNDLEELESQYGNVDQHINEEAQSRYIAGVGIPSYFGNLTVIGFSANV